MSNVKLIAVVGGTGAQGGGLVQAILNDPEGGFRVRVLTRDAESEKAKALATQGAEVVTADLDNVNQLRAAFDGAYGAFCVTNFWEHFSPEQEQSQARNLARATKDAGVQHVIWSTLEDTRDWMPLTDDRMPTLQGKYKVPHLDAKGESNTFFTELDVPTTFLYTSFYWDNFIYFGSGPARGADGKYAITMPLGNAKMPGIASKDIGGCAYGVFKKGPETIGTSIGIAGEHLSGSEMAAGLGRALGVDVGFNDVAPEVYRSFDFPGADDLGNMFQFYRDFEDDVRGRRPVDASRALNPDLMSFDTWLAAYADKIPME